MSGSKQRVQYHLDVRDVKSLPECGLCQTIRTATMHNRSCVFHHESGMGPMGWGMIYPVRHVTTPFHLSQTEWEDSFELLKYAKAFLDQKLAPEGYNVTLDCGPVAGQYTNHAYITIIPRFKDEPLAGRGLRYRLKQPTNQRRSGIVDNLATERLAVNKTCFFERTSERVLVGSGVILTYDSTRVTVFDLSVAEWLDTYWLLRDVKKILDQRYQPDGYTLGWNCGRVGGQEVFHVHMHVIPRFADEPLAGKGMQELLS